jgi:hypothetical protein
MLCHDQQMPCKEAFFRVRAKFTQMFYAPAALGSTALSSTYQGRGTCW